MVGLVTLIELSFLSFDLTDSFQFIWNHSIIFGCPGFPPASLPHKWATHTHISPLFLIAKGVVDTLQPQAGREGETCKCLWCSYFNFRSNNASQKHSLLCTLSHPFKQGVERWGGKVQLIFSVGKCYFSLFESCSVNRILLPLARLLWQGTSVTIITFAHVE